VPSRTGRPRRPRPLVEEGRSPVSKPAHVPIHRTHLPTSAATPSCYVNVPSTYLLECSDGSFYVGSTWNLDRRVSEHNEGLGAIYTRHRRPVRLVWSAEFARVEDAYAFEKRIQGWGRRKREALIAGEYDALPILASRSADARRRRQ
jgi:putative endonuclease